MKFVGKNVVIYGAGISGRAAYELVRDKGAKAIVYDDDPNVLHATNSKGVFDGADIIVLSPGVNGEKDFLLDAKLENKTVIGELELASRICVAEQIAITGTNGKTTTTMLIDYIFKRAGLHSHAVGNIGAPFCAIADKLDATEIAVIEASSFQLENALSFAPDTAVLLNISPDHLSRHGSMERYISAKANVFLHQSEQDYVVYNDDDEIVRQLIPKMIAQKIPFSISHPVDGAYVSSGFICFKGKPVVATEEIDFSAKELENALAAVAVAMIHGVSAYCVASALTDFSKPKYRRERVGEIDGIHIFNDSKSTNVSACLCACQSIGNCVLMMGGQKGREDFEYLFENLPQSVVYICVCGENGDVISEKAFNAGYANISMYKDIKDALSAALDKAKELGVENVLFSPASKSFDGFRNFEERGRYFNSCVSQIKLGK